MEVFRNASLPLPVKCKYQVCFANMYMYLNICVYNSYIHMCVHASKVNSTRGTIVNG